MVYTTPEKVVPREEGHLLRSETKSMVFHDRHFNRSYRHGT